MAWMNEQTLYNYSSRVYFIGNIDVSSVTHSGTNLRVQGTVAVGARGTTGYYASYDHGIQELPGNGSWNKIVNDNAQLKVGSPDYHASFDVTIPNVPASATTYSFPVSFKACFNSTCTSTYWDVTKYWTITFSQSGDPPTGGYITYNSCTHNSVNATTGVADWGADGGELQAIIVTGSQNGYADPVTSSNWTVAGRRVLRVPNVPTSTLSATVDATDSSTTLLLDNPLSIKGMLHYKIAYWNGNNMATLSGLDETQRRLPPAPSQFTYGTPSGSTNLTYPVTFAGNAADNHTVYVHAQLNRTIRYKIGSGNWTYIDNATVADVDFVTSFNVTVPAGQVATVEGWQTYFGMDSEVSRITLSNTNAQAYLYGSVNNATKKLGPIYASVNGRTKKLKKIYASAGGITKKVYEDV